MGCEKSQEFVVARKFTLKCDHAPLKFLFDPKKEIPKCWAIKLMGLDYEIKYCEGRNNQQADAMSRLRFEEEEQKTQDEKIIMCH